MLSRERAKRSDWARCTLLPLLFLPRARCARSLSVCILSSLASQAFVGFVIIPIIGNAAEHSTAIVMAAKGKMDLAFGVALGSSTQIALFVIPFMVLVAWGMDKPLDLFFGTPPMGVGDFLVVPRPGGTPGLKSQKGSSAAPRKGGGVMMG